MPNTADTIQREVKGRTFTFYRNQRYLVNDETGDIEIYVPQIAKKTGWSEYDPIRHEIITTVKDATPIRMAELDAVKSERDQAQEDLAELQEQFDALVDVKLALEKQNFDLVAQIQAFEVVSESVSAPEEEEAAAAPESTEGASEPHEMAFFEQLIISALATGRVTVDRATNLAKAIIGEFPTPEALHGATGAELEDIPGIGPSTASKVLAAIATVETA